MVTNLRKRSGPAAIVLFALVSLTGCPSSNQADESTVRDAEIYRSVIIDLADRAVSAGALATTTDDDELPVVYIEAFDPDGISLEVQVEVVAAFEDDYRIRFIDDRGEALDPDSDDGAVRSDSILIGLGPIANNGTTDVRGELYLAVDRVEAFRYTLVESGDRWVISGSPEQVEPEGFVDEG